MKTTAKVSGFARSFISGEPIVGATITALENPELLLQTDTYGQFGPFDWYVGEPMTLVLEKTGSFWSGYKTTQTATMIVPPEGFNNENYLKNISFQVPSNMAYKFLSFAMGDTENPQACQIAATITPLNTTMDDIPQGIAGVKVTLSPEVNNKPFYFDIFPLVDKTNPFVRTLNATSLDGGVVFINVPPGEYTMTAEKEGTLFSQVHVKARAGILVNASPPHGPNRLTQPQVNTLEKKPNHFSFFKPAIIAAGVVTVGACIAALTIS